MTFDTLRELRPRYQVVVVLDPFHPLGLAVCRRLALDGLRPVAVSADPVAAESFCSRLAIEGFTVPHRTIDNSFPNCESWLAEDLREVYGGLRGMLSFFEARSRHGRWLDVPLTVADEVLRRSMSRRLRMLRALAPLLAHRGFLHNVVMGKVRRDGTPLAQVEGATAYLWDDLLAEEWEQRGVMVRRTYTRLQLRDPVDDLDHNVNRVLDDFHRCLRQTQPADMA